jgi:hypothetical protein
MNVLNADELAATIPQSAQSFLLTLALINRDMPTVPATSCDRLHSR